VSPTSPPVKIRASELREGDLLFEPSGDVAGWVLGLHVRDDRVRVRVTQPGLLEIDLGETVIVDAR
jgi:hypothetical protein